MLVGRELPQQFTSTGESNNEHSNNHSQLSNSTSFSKKQKLMAARCLKCGKIHLPPRPLCDNCFSQDFEWISVSGKGKLLTYTVISVAPQQFQALTPYAVGIVELESGLKIPGMINGLNARATEDRHGVNFGLWHMQHNAGVATMAQILF